MLVFVLLSALSMAQESSSASYAPDPDIKTCDDYVAAMQAYTTQSQAVANNSAKRATEGQTVYERSKVLQATSAHLKKTGVYDAACEAKLSKAQLSAMPLNNAENARGAQGLEMMQQVQACTQTCASKHQPEDNEMKTCMEACAAAVKPMPVR